MKKNRGIKAGRSYNKRYNKRKARKERVKRHTRERPGTRPISVFHPDHPARKFGWMSDEAQNRDRRLWE